MKNIKFNKDFLIGAATSGPQTESGFDLDKKSESVWDFWHKTNPELFFDGLAPQNNVRKNFKDLVRMAKDTNLNSLRTSIQWTRFMPDGKNISQEALEFYREYFSELKRNNIKVMACLMHFDVPMWLHEKGGFETKESIEHFVLYAENAFKSFGDLVDTWFVFNEPIVPVEMGYFNTLHLPGIIDVKKGYQVLFNYLITCLKTIKKFKSLEMKSEIGVIVNITPPIPRTQSKEDQEAAEWFAIFQYKSFLDPIIHGEFPQKLLEHAVKHNYMWEASQEEWDLIASKVGIDLLGLNYYSPKRVQKPIKQNGFDLFKPLEEQLWSNYTYPGARMNVHRNWEILPEAIYTVIKNVQNNYNNQKMFISENGIGVAKEQVFKSDNRIQDAYRIEFFKEHLVWVHKAIQEGANCIGYHIWTLVDNWSWLNAYKNRYGLYELECATGETRAKLSQEWFSKFALKKEFDE